MLQTFLLAGQLSRESGQGPALDLGVAAGKPLHLTLGITRIVAQESLQVLIYASADGENWDDKPVLSLPKKSYCGTYNASLDLRERPAVKYLRATWQMQRWDPREPSPLFDFFIKAEETQSAVATASA